MRPVDFQPAVVQSPNVSGSVQQAATGAQVTQQAFADQLRQTAAERPNLVQAPVASAENQAAQVESEDRGERQARRPPRPRPRGRRPDGDQPESPTKAAPGALRGTRVNLVV